MYRERLTITLESNLLSAIDSMIDGQLLRNRSQTIEHLLKEGIGLHEIHRAFLFFTASLESKQLEAVTAFCLNNEINELLLGLPAGQTALLGDIQMQIRQQASNMSLVHVPTDFGTAGALILQRASLNHPFLIINLNTSLHLPDNILPAYTFHRLLHAPLTRLIRPSANKQYTPCGIEIVSPEMLLNIPAGIASLIDDVYPVMEKEGKVRTYVTD